VAREADSLLRKKCAIDMQKTAVDLEDSGLITRIFQLILGSPELLRQTARAAESNATATSSMWRQPVSHALQIRLLKVCCKSVVACNMAPLTLQVCATALQRPVYGEMLVVASNCSAQHHLKSE
jgi:hypothetical protein